MQGAEEELVAIESELHKEADEERERLIGEL